MAGVKVLVLGTTGCAATPVGGAVPVGATGLLYENPSDEFGLIPIL